MTLDCASSEVQHGPVALRRYRLLVVLSSLFVLVPIWTVHYLPLNDYANHLSRCYILAHYSDVSLYQAHYWLDREPLPNLACDLLVPFFMRVLNVEIAGKLFLTLTLILFVTGSYLLANSESRRGSWFVLVVPFLFYCSQLYYGSLNFLFGVSLFLIAWACWLRFRKRWTLLRVLVCASLTVLVYYAHLAAAALLLSAATVVLCLDVIGNRTFTRQHLISILAVVAPIPLYVIYAEGSGRIGGMSSLVWGGPLNKVLGALSPFISYDYWLDGVALLLLAAGVLYLCRYRKSIRFDFNLLIPAVMFSILYLLFPVMLFGSSGADVRFVLPAWVLLFLSIQVSVPRQNGRILLTAGLAIMLLRLVAIEGHWLTFSDEIATQVDLLDKLPPRSTIYPFYDWYQISSDKRQRFFKSIVCYAVFRRTAFTPETFACAGQQPIVSREAIRGDANGVFAPHSQADWDTIFAQNQYFWTYRASDTVKAELQQHCYIIARNAQSELWKRNLPL